MFNFKGLFMKSIVFMIVVSATASSYACDGPRQVYYYPSNCHQTYQPTKESQKFSPLPQQPEKSSPLPERVPTDQPTIPERVPTEDFQPIIPERIETPTTIKYKTKINDGLVIEVPSTMPIETIAYINVEISSGERMVVPLINNRFPTIKGNRCLYDANSAQYTQKHYNILVQQGYLKFRKSSNLVSGLASN